MASRYTAELNLVGVNDSHMLAIGRVPARSAVLDLGAADGSVAAMLKELGCRVWGVERDPIAAEEATRYCEEVAVDDLNELDLADRFPGQRFDVVLMLDILEHLTRPVELLRRVGSVLADGGWGVISVPNVAHLSVRLALLQGSFTYTDLGLLDRTHLKFFDRAGVDGLLSESGWGMFEMVRVTRRFGTTEIQVPDADPDLVRELESDVEALTYQFVVSGAPLGSVVLEHPPTLPAAAVQVAYLELQDEARRREDEIRALRESALPDLAEQLSAIRKGSIDRRNQLRYLLAAMQEDTERLRISLSG
ncbi:MAG: class I SAM-dependent methyltransferase [Candidatus Dormibacteria bacterium]